MGIIGSVDATIQKNTKELKAVDFFCGGGGMTHGLRQAGIAVIAGVDFDKSVGLTYEYNNPGSKFINTDIRRLRSNFLEKNFGLQKYDDNLIFVGCSPCQYYSVINTDHTKALQSKDLLRNFARFVEYYRPGIILVENVPGIMTNRDSILPEFLRIITKIGYVNCTYEVIDMSYYGVPQTRKRFSLIASRLSGLTIPMPPKDEEKAILKDYLGVSNGFPKIPAGHKDNTDFNHTTAGLSPKSLLRLAKTTHDGGSRLCWANDTELQLPCYIGKDNCFNDNYGRMWWNRPAPTITTKFFSVSNGRFAHPEEDRAISIREGATLQTFPVDYVFKTSSIANAAKIIGNAVPCEYARRLGEHIRHCINL
ncbi:MAG: DNA cytosine methyltransferase [Prevotella sp.]|nr:DNA cytosine methyltransferase [Prevotella sp.]